MKKIKTTKSKAQAERKTRFFTPSGLSLARIYGRGQAAGEFPFTRGIHPTMYRGRLWTMRQYAGFGSAKEANKRYRYLLAHGATGISVAFDLPTQMGLDPDSPKAKGEVGRVGVSISTLEDMRQLLDGLPLDKLSISMTINATAPILLAMLYLVAKERGIRLSKLSGTTQNDILKEYIARGTYIFPVQQGLRLATDLITWASSALPNWNTISISGYHIREAGSTAIEEVAFTLANAIAYVEQVQQRGLSVDSFAKRLAFFFNCHNNFLEEVAKFRAARTLWAKIMRRGFAAKDPRSMMLRFHTQTAGSSLTAQRPLNNVVRTTVQAMAAVLGGTQSLHTNAFDEALALPTEASAKVALRTQQVLAHESGLGDVVDPLGGSYCIEALTREIEKQAAKLIAKIDRAGGMLSAIERSIPQDSIELSASRYQAAIESKEQIVVGVNQFSDNAESAPQLFKYSSFIEAAQVRAIRRYRRAADRGLSQALSLLSQQAKGKGNLLPAIIRSLKNGATLGDIASSLELVWGRFG